MLIIGELINSTRKEVKEALASKDERTIRRLAREQIKAGAGLIDVNTATSRKQELNDMVWAIELIQDEVGENVGLTIDSPNAEVIEKGLSMCKGRALVNSVNNKKDSVDTILPLIKKYDAEVIGLTMGTSGMPKNAEDRLNEAEQLITSIEHYGISPERLYIDTLVMTVGSNQDQASYIIDSVRKIKQKWGGKGVKTSVGLSNVSHGLPKRTMINRAFLAMLLQAGLDAAIIDPLDCGMIDMLFASEAVLGKDKSCLKYLKRMRERI
ncbi:MAG: dihydropteroate synthase [Victivallales bacterium]|nr:dihydropteroate synthase [Victivallales bacterium]